MQVSGWVLAAWAATTAVFVAVVVAVDDQDDAQRFFVIAAFTSTALLLSIALSRTPYVRGAWVGLTAGGALMLTLLGALSIGIFLVPGLVLWWMAAARHARTAGWATVGAAAVFGFGLTGAAVVAV